MSAEAELAQQHVNLIAASAISPDVATARGYRTVTTKAELKRLGFNSAQASAPALLLPVHSVTGETPFYQIRPDNPRIVNGKPLKYETPRGARMVVDVPPACRAALANPSVPLFITEGIRKADAGASLGLCIVGLIGVWNWRGTNEHGGKTILADFEQIALNGRNVYICYDSDVMVKEGVRLACARLTAVLKNRDAHVLFVLLPAMPDGGKQGLDDYLASGKTVDDLLRLASQDLQETVNQVDDKATYIESGGGLVWRKPTRDGCVETALTNFTARIFADVAEDDGAETRTVFKLEAKLRGRTVTFQLPTAQFGAMNWPAEYLGASAIVYPGFGARDHARVAIQVLSGEIPREHVYAHTGWREIEGKPVYLHAGGAIGADGMRNDVIVALPPALAGYELPPPSDGDDLRQSVRATLGLLDVAPHRLTYPLLSLTYRAACGPMDFSHHLSGPTGAGKTELAALFQRHYGATMNARNLPGSWESTANANEAYAFKLKDALYVVDDFMPNARGSDAQRLHRDADRLLRAKGNRSGRARMRSDTTLRPATPPRAAILSTGEDVPRGQSLRARILIQEMGPDELDWSVVTQCQQDAAAGLFAAAMAGFLRWLAQKYPKTVGTFDLVRNDVMRLRSQLTSAASHRRSPEIIAELSAGLSLFLDYAVAVGAITADEADAHGRIGWDAFQSAAQAQAGYQAAGEPTGRFLELLVSSLTSGRAHLARDDGEAPERAESWGWRSHTVGTGGFQRDEWRPQGDRVGWIDGDDIYLEPDAAYTAIRKMANDAGDSFALTKDVLVKRLHERGYLASTEKQYGELSIRRTLNGQRRRMWHLRAASLYPAEKSGQSGQDGDSQGSLPFAWPNGRPDFDAAPEVSSQQVAYVEPELVGAGRIGRASETEEAAESGRASDGPIQARARPAADKNPTSETAEDTARPDGVTATEVGERSSVAGDPGSLGCHPANGQAVGRGDIYVDPSTGVVHDIPASEL